MERDGGGWAVRGRLYLSTEPFGVAMSPRSAGYRPDKPTRPNLRDISLIQG